MLQLVSYFISFFCHFSQNSHLSAKRLIQNLLNVPYHHRQGLSVLHMIYTLSLSWSFNSSNTSEKKILLLHQPSYQRTFGESFDCQAIGVYLLLTIKNSIHPLCDSVSVKLAKASLYAKIFKCSQIPKSEMSIWKFSFLTLTTLLACFIHAIFCFNIEFQALTS